MNERIGQHYDIVRELRRGSWVTVYEARHAILGRRTLVKWLNPSHAEDRELVGRLEREARLGAAVDHPNVGSIYEVGEAEGRPFVAMEWIEGEDLDRIIEREAPLRPERALLLARDLLAGLGAIHAAGVVHRDLSPANVRITPEGRARITDFGLATGPFDTRYTLPGSVIGTPGYLSPEQAAGKEADERSDLFAVGVLLHEALTGEPLFRGGDVIAVLKRIREQPAPALEPRLPDLPAGADAWMARLLAKDPDERFPSAEQAQAALVELGGDIQGMQEVNHADNGAEAPVRRRRPTAVWVLLAVLLVALPGYYYRTLLLPGIFDAGPEGGVVPDTLLEETARDTTLVPSRAESLFAAPESSLVGSLDEAADRETPHAAATPALAPGEEGEGDRPAAGEREERASSPDTVRTSFTPPDTAFTPEGGEEVRDAAPASSRAPENAESGAVAAEAAPTGWLMVRTQPWAEVYIAAERVGATPELGVRQLPAGEVRITFDNPGFPPIPYETKIKPGDTTRLSLDLLDHVAPLNLSVVPWAEVILDDQPLGETPLQQPVYLSPGEHTLVLTHPEFGSFRRRVVARAGVPIQVTVDMEQDGTSFAPSSPEDR